jgi:hypothetical protein
MMIMMKAVVVVVVVVVVVCVCVCVRREQLAVSQRIKWISWQAGVQRVNARAVEKRAQKSPHQSVAQAKYSRL